MRSCPICFPTKRTNPLWSAKAGIRAHKFPQRVVRHLFPQRLIALDPRLVPMLRNFNETARYVDQGGGKRKGSFAMYLEPWHADVFDFLELRKNHGKAIGQWVWGGGGGRVGGSRAKGRLLVGLAGVTCGAVALFSGRPACGCE